MDYIFRAIVIAAIGAMAWGIVIEPAIRSDEKQAEIDAEDKKEAIEKAAADYLTAVKNHSGIINNLMFMQHEQTGICFAILDRYREGYMAQVDCNDVPDGMLIVARQGE